MFKRVSQQCRAGGTEAGWGLVREGRGEDRMGESREQRSGLLLWGSPAVGSWARKGE